MIPGSEVPLRTPLHDVAVRIHLRRTYTVCSLYLAPGVPIARDDLVELLHQLSEPFLLVGDFNIRHPSWGDTVASPNAAMLLSVASDFSLCCLNSGLPTHYHRSTDSFSCIDLSFCSSSVVLDFTWSRLPSFCGSDHYPILLSEVHPSPILSGSSRWNFDRADWAGFSLATEISTSLSSFAFVDAAFRFFNDLILDAATNFIPRVSSSGKIHLPRWNPDCSAVSSQKAHLSPLAKVAVPSGPD